MERGDEDGKIRMGGEYLRPEPAALRSGRKAVPTRSVGTSRFQVATGFRSGNRRVPFRTSRGGSLSGVGEGKIVEAVLLVAGNLACGGEKAEQ